MIKDLLIALLAFLDERDARRIARDAEMIRLMKENDLFRKRLEAKGCRKGGSCGN